MLKAPLACGFVNSPHDRLDVLDHPLLHHSGFHEAMPKIIRRRGDRRSVHDPYAYEPTTGEPTRFRARAVEPTSTDCWEPLLLSRQSHTPRSCFLTLPRKIQNTTVV